MTSYKKVYRLVAPLRYVTRILYIHTHAITHIYIYN